MAKVLPHSQEAEESLLGCFILNPGTFQEYVRLTKDDFYYPKNQEIFKALEALSVSGSAIDSTTLSDALEKSGTLEKIGGIKYLTEIVSKATTFNAKEYSQIVKDLSTTRQLIKVSQEITESAYNHHEDINALLTEAESKIYNLSHTESEQKALEPIGKIVFDTLSKIYAVMNAKGELSGIGSGFVDLDRLTHGFQDSDLIILAARPAMGKTAFALNVAVNAAVYENKKVVIFSLEMSDQQLAQRMILSESCVNGMDLKTGNMNSEKWKAIMYSSEQIAFSNIYINDSPGMTVPEISSICRKKKMDEGIDLIIIDYMQLMQGTRNRENRQQEISEISRNLKQLAREMNCPVLCLSQLARGPETRNDKRPILSDLRDSGSIEQDADIVLFLYRDSYYNPDENPYLAELIVAKHRNGPTGKIQLSWSEEYAKFSNYTDREEGE